MMGLLSGQAPFSLEKCQLPVCVLHTVGAQWRIPMLIALCTFSLSLNFISTYVNFVLPYCGFLARCLRSLWGVSVCVCVLAVVHKGPHESITDGNDGRMNCRQSWWEVPHLKILGAPPPEGPFWSVWLLGLHTC